MYSTGYSSLTQDELPTKLRCAICSKLAVNAFRLPCCETAICENCQATLPSSCPVCEHSPVSGADCTIYKSLRTTIRVFLKTEEKKREAARPKTNGSTPTTSVQATPTPTPTQVEATTGPPVTETSVPDRTNSEHLPADAVAAVVDSSVDTKKKMASDEPVDSRLDAVETNGHPPDEQHVENKEAKESDPQDQVTVEATGEDVHKGDTVVEVGADQSEQAGMNFGFDPLNNNFNMNFGNGDMNQMQMMMAMQNGMNPAAFGSFPMMGMMDPMMMQNMLMSGGFGAQGMGMNMNMGMNGFSSGGDDWNGQQSWNVGQDNFNPNAPGMGNGDFGNFNANFRTGNYGHHNQFNDHRRGNYGFRGRGRGRGFYGGYGRGYHQNYSNQNFGWADGQSSSASQPVDAASGNVDEFGRTIRADQPQDGESVGQNGQDAAAAQGGDNTGSETQNQVVKELVPESEETQGDNTKHHGDVSAVHRQAIATGPLDSLPLQRVAPDVPLNAPTGPKAMRQGLPNTSLHNLKARGYIKDERTPSLGTNGPVVASPLQERAKSRSSSLQSSKDKDRHQRDRHRERDVDEKDRGRDHDRVRGRSRTHSISRSRSPTHSHSRDRKESRRHRRHRSPSVSDDSRDGDHRRRKHRSKRHSTRDDEDYKGRSRGDKYDERSRSASPTDREYKRSSHRSHRDRDRDRDRDEKRRERDKDRGRDSDHDRHRKSGHRSSHRERDEDREREKERDRTRDKDRSRELDKDHRNHDSKTPTVAPPTPVEPSEKGFNPPTGPRGSFSIKGAGGKSSIESRGAGNRSSDLQRREGESSRRASQSSATGGQKLISNATAKDPHTLEREARDRERLLKEAQRIAGMAGLAGRSSGKRSRDAGDDRGGRRKSRRSEAVSMNDEERMRRIEAEREGRRWE
ncbi:hypothetical protein F5Y19DRAFT_117546 [Xylariaceae sp. FL1651]|nr:hypothetical protein F5Y19DRAFT_117546 [Xylariaceae sp. FL1651]